MSDDDHEPLLGILSESVHDKVRILMVEGSRGLIRKQHLRVIHHGSCDCHSLSLSSGELGGYFAQLLFL